MPTACEELRDEWRFYDRRVSSDDVAETYLRAAGFKITRGWDFILPTDKTIEAISDQEYRAMLYLVHEWDFGGIYEGDRETAECR